MIDEFKDLVRKLLEPIPATKKDIQEGMREDDNQEIVICPYVCSEECVCNFYFTTGIKPTRLDCYICRTDN